MNGTIAKLLSREPVDWEAVKSCIVNALGVNGVNNARNTPSVLPSVVKKDAPVEIVRLLLPSAKLKTLRNAFDCACANEHLGAGVKELLLEEMNPTPSLAEILLFSAIKYNCEDAINIIIERNVNFLSPGFYYNTFREDEMFAKLCEILIQRQLVVHKDLIFHSQALHASAYRGHTILTNLIVNQYPGTLTTRDRDGNLPLHCACKSEDFETARILLRKGIETNQFKNGAVGGLLVLNKNKKSALRLACGSGADAYRISEAVKWLNDVDPTLLSYSNVIKDVNLIHLVARHGDVASTKILLKENRSSISWKDQFGNTPLALACQHGHFDVATELYEMAKEEKGLDYRRLLRDAIATALKEGVNPDPFVVFVVKTDIESARIQDIALLHHVAGKGSVRYASILVDSRPDCMSLKDATGSLPIHWACREQNSEMIAYLLGEGSSRIEFEYEYGGLFAPDDQGLTPLQSLLVAFSEPGDGVLHASYCILACTRLIQDLPLIHFALDKLDLDVGIIEEMMEKFDQYPMCTWRQGKTSLFYALDVFAKNPQDEDSSTLLDIFVSRDSNYRQCAYIEDDEGRLPLHYALGLDLRWEPCIKKLVDASFLSLADHDGKTGLLPFMLSALGPSSDLDTIFKLLRSDPTLSK